MTKQHNDYYTYAFLREDKTPYYIGKGRGNRAYDKRKTIKPPKDKSRILFLKKNLTEAEAFKHEIYMIFVFGRKDLGTGILRNLTSGGEGPSGAVRSSETRKKISVARKGKYAGEKNPRFGVPHTEETKKKMSEAQSGEKHPQYGVPLTEEHKKKISVANFGEKSPHYGVPWTEEQKKAQSEKMCGEKNPMFGMSGEKSPNYGNTGALNPCSKAIIAIEPDGTQRHFGSGHEAARELRMNRRSLCYFLEKGHVSTKGEYKGWQFFYENR